jgi:Right handed beta helix region
MKQSLLPLFALIAATPIAAQSGRPAFFVEESGRGFWRLDEAVAAIGEGKGTISIAPGIYNDCAVQKAGAITFRAEQPGTVTFDGGTCNGKAAFVLQGQFARVEGLIFQNMRVDDRNGSGIRLENGDLEVENAIFRNSEQGILTNSYVGGHITVNRSTFTGLGGCPGGMCSHSIYVNNIEGAVVTNCRFERATGGHYVKLRSRVSQVSGNSFDDTRGHESNYMVDLPDGSTGAVTNNVFVQGRDKENYSTMIAVAAEHRINRTSGLVIAGNTATLAPGVEKETTFVRDWSHEPLRIGDNRLGKGIAPFALQ